MSDVRPEPAHPEALSQWRELAGEPSPEAEEWARQALGVTEADRRAS
jgi:hypothetical protein